MSLNPALNVARSSPTLRPPCGFPARSVAFFMSLCLLLENLPEVSVWNGGCWSWRCAANRVVLWTDAAVPDAGTIYT